MRCVVSHLVADTEGLSLVGSSMLSPRASTMASFPLRLAMKAAAARSDRMANGSAMSKEAVASTGGRGGGVGVGPESKQPVEPLRVAAVLSAPTDKRYSTTAVCPAAAAKWSGVWPSLFLASTIIPFSRRNLTVSNRPANAAPCKCDQPFEQTA